MIGIGYNRLKYVYRMINNNSIAYNFKEAINTFLNFFFLPNVYKTINELYLYLFIGKTFAESN